MTGGTVCASHGGSAKQVRAAAARRSAEQAAREAVVTLGLPVDVTPTEALLDEVRWTAGHVHWLRAKVAEHDERALVWGVTRTEAEAGAALLIGIDGDGDVTDVGSAPSTKIIQAASPSIWYELYAKERAHLVAVCTAALRAGVEERRVRLAEQQGDLVATAIRRILDALNLTPDQQQLVGDVVPRELRAIAAGGTP